MADGLLVRQVEVSGAGVVDCRVRDGLIVELRTTIPVTAGETVIEGEGGALLPGFADHHLHLAALAAAQESLDAGNLSREQLGTAIGAHVGRLRVIGYDEERHGDLDSAALDSWSREAVRVQHRSGALWVLNSAALAELPDLSHPGVETDASGRPTGRLWRADEWLRSVRPPKPPSLRDVSAQLAAAGFTHLTDATPDRAAGELLTSAMAHGEIAQHLMVMADGVQSDRSRLHIGPLKVVVPDHQLPDLDTLTNSIARGHEQGRPVAVHCVTREALALTLAALDLAGSREGDRIEHCSVADAGAAAELARRGLRVVTQPCLVEQRGDDYLARVAASDREDLWPYATLIAAGVQVAPSSDAPYGVPDPWLCLRAATTRHTSSGQVLGAHQLVPPETVLAGLLSPLDDPGGSPRRVEVGAPADLVLLDRPLREAVSGCRATVLLTTVAGTAVHDLKGQIGTIDP